MIKIQQNISLAPYTTFKIGGPARFFCEVKSEDELMEALNYARNNKLEFFILGGGSNILVSDDGFKGLVIKIKNQISKCKMTMQSEKCLVECWAGENLANLVKFSAENNLSGLEWAAGIPGTIGGAARGNAGAFGLCMADAVESVKIFNASDNSNIIYDENQKSKIKNQNYNSKLKIIDNKNCKFGYRTSTFKESNNLIITSVILRLQKGDKAEIEAKAKENIKKRVEKQPKGFSAGSFFKNPAVKNEEIRRQFETDTGLKCKDDKIPAGWLIEEIGFLGKKVGRVQVSENHGNFVINLGGGKAEDVVILASLIKQKVREKFHIQLIEEVQFVGF